jgi:hypothetical protein
MVLPKCLRKYADKIREVSDERDSDDGYWVYLASGYRDDEGETHCIHEDTPTECAAKMKYITKCTKLGCCDTMR